MASTAAAPPSGPHEAGAAPADGSIELLRSALAAAETLLLGACAHATPSVVAALGDTAALLSRASAVKAAASSLCNALAMQQPAADGADGGVDAAVSEESVEFSSLPHCLVVRVLAALPADARLRCAEVCRAWRTAVSDRTLWLCVDLSPARGVVHTVNDALLLAVAVRAAGLPARHPRQWLAARAAGQQVVGRRVWRRCAGAGASGGGAREGTRFRGRSHRQSCSLFRDDARRWARGRRYCVCSEERACSIAMRVCA
jgi:hypothetical protein